MLTKEEIQMSCEAFHQNIHKRLKHVHPPTTTTGYCLLAVLAHFSPLLDLTVWNISYDGISLYIMILIMLGNLTRRMHPKCSSSFWRMGQTLWYRSLACCLGCPHTILEYRFESRMLRWRSTFLLMFLGNNWHWLNYCHPCGRPRWSFWMLVSVWSSPRGCNNLKIKLDDKMVFISFLALSLPFPFKELNETFKTCIYRKRSSLKFA